MTIDMSSSTIECCRRIVRLTHSITRSMVATKPAGTKRIPMAVEVSRAKKQMLFDWNPLLAMPRGENKKKEKKETK